jgi:hypothetical protein
MHRASKADANRLIVLVMTSFLFQDSDTIEDLRSIELLLTASISV